MGYFDAGSNASFISLIPKGSAPLSFGEFRPISLINSLYKIISKILANRLKSVIDSIIGSEQSAFISNRNILDGPLIVSECISWAKNSKKQILIFKVDLDKAFDSVNWDFLDDSMVQMNLGLGGDFGSETVSQVLRYLS